MKIYWYIGVAVILLGGALVTGPHWWILVAKARVTYGSINSPQSSVYRSAHGMLVAVDHSGRGEIYFFDTSRHEVGMPNRQNFRLFPGFAYSRHAPPLSAPMAKAGVDDPELVIDENRLEFNGYGNVRIRVTW